MLPTGKHPRSLILATLLIVLTMTAGNGHCSPLTNEFTRLEGGPGGDSSPSTSEFDHSNGGNVIPAGDKHPTDHQPQETPQFPDNEDRRPVTTTTGSTFDLSSHSQSVPSSSAPEPVTLLDRISESNSKFTWDVYRGLAAPAAQNVFFSPYSLVNALGMLAMASGHGTARDQLLRALRVDPTLQEDALDRGIQQENLGLRSTDQSASLQLLVANKFYVERSRASNINPEYLQNISDYYGGSMQAVNFSTDLSGTVRLINGWVSEQTRGVIKNLVPDDLDPRTQLILANAIFFNGTWSLPFNPVQNFQGKFHLPPSADGGAASSVPVQLMTQSSSMLYAADEELGVETVVLPYKGEPSLAMHIILPVRERPLSSLEESGVLTAESIRNLAARTRLQMVQLSMPKFALRQEMALSDLMKRLNATDVFHPLKNDFANIFLNPRPGFFVNEILHQAVVEVDERGTVAAGATAIIGTRSSFPRIPVLVNRPFLFYIADESNGFILFWGRVGDPSKFN